MQSFQDMCTKFAQIANGKASMEHGVCSVRLNRNLNVMIQGRPSRSALHAGITFESLDIYGNALNLGEVVVLEEELSRFVKVLAENNLIISAVHNHWIYSDPAILYVHFQSIEPPLIFAQKFAQAFRLLKNY
ncbi:DUF1259 domain-containing protein [Lysinibacillus xylanilyticus]|uniref:DUF1259 domain-containing protein n=1 Tax=Lysinibacillus xylanilyticus TaxID=582475 RepID=A0ABT4EJX6_9BACI|nr:DUF1259 domain-containing protein [Lysinibacillus xylanilyticus]MCY9545936.1 DUF1259 domain-containing protein [Lysinibacillus xylanilyticus]MED3800398.1 DUF1259 domain-containing protein [Lysinibacillus xylanilyticus]